MGIHTTDAIVLRRYLFRETSVVVSCLTDKFGKIRGLVKGLRGPQNRHRSAMEPMTVNRIVFYDTHNSQIHLISQCDLTAPLSSLQRDLETARTAALCVELADTVTPLEDPQPAVYHLLKESLERLAGGAADNDVRIRFVARLLYLTGFQPQLDECTGCAQPVHAAGFWSPKQGGLLCPQCLHQDPKAEPALPDTLEALDALSHSDDPGPLDARLASVLRQRLDEFLRWRLDRPLRTLHA
jgi:DNA repair protein RecO (recombination protein O)